MKPKIDFSLENAAWPALLVDDTGTIRSANQAAVTTLGSAVEGESPLLSSVWAPENPFTPEQFLVHWQRSPIKQVSITYRLKGGNVGVIPTHLCSLMREGQRYYVFQFLTEISAPTIRADTAARAESAPPPMDAGVAQKQKLDCAMQLIRSVVLDFNNALTTILGHTSLILTRVQPGHPWRNSLVEVEKSAEKAAEIAHYLAAFSRQEKDVHGLAPGNLNDLLRRTVELFQTQKNPTLQWTLQLESRLRTAKFDEAKMQQAFVKILDNATQAVGDHGSLVVRTRNLDVTEPLRDGGVAIVPGHYVCVEINDAGCGITPEIMPRVFEPFFTTKPSHRGLGLAWVYGIVTNHGGSVAITSLPGQGTQVRVYLPALKRIVKDQAYNYDELSGAETILIVDDDDMVLTMGQTILASFGYNVITAGNAHKALDIVSDSGNPIDLVITDLVMPNISGRELVERLHKLAPRLKFLCVSGYVCTNHPEGEEDNYLQKPFTSQELLRKVKQVLA